MKISILIDMLFDLLSKRKITAAYFAEKYNLSPRSVYRYVDVLSEKIPLLVKRGRNGGIYLSDNYRLPVGFMSAEEYSASIDALIAAYENSPEQRFLDAKRKLSSQIKTEKHNLTVMGNCAFSVEENIPALSERARILETCIQECLLVEIEYLTEEKRVLDKMEPHALIFQNNTWYVYAFSHEQRDFSLFSLGRITSLSKSETSFRRRSFSLESLPKKQSEKGCPVRLEISPTALTKGYEWLGAENVKYQNGVWIAEPIFPDEESALQALLRFGLGAKVLAPKSLKEKLLSTVKTMVALYE